MLNQFVLSMAEVQNTMISNILVVTGSFVLLLILIKRFAWDSISAILKKREETIANDLDSAERSRIEAVKLEDQRKVQLNNSRSEAAEIIKQAKDSGEVSRQAIMTDAKEEASQMKEKAQTAMLSIKDEVADLSLQIAEKILVQEISLENHQTLIDQCLDNIGQNNEA